MTKRIWDNDLITEPLRQRWHVKDLPLPFCLVRWYWQRMPVKRGGTRLVWLTCRFFGRGAFVKATLPNIMTITMRLENTQYEHIWTHYGMYEPDTLRILLNILEPGDIFVDVGANWGFFSLLAGHRVGNSGKVYAFEPNPEVFHDLQRHITETRLRNILPLRYACFDTSADFELVLPRSRASGLGSIVNKNKQGSKRFTVRTVRLDEFFRSIGEKPSLIKVDAEGAEYKILIGCTRLVEETVESTYPIFLVEYTPSLGYYDFSLEDLTRWFSRYAYKILYLLPGGNIVQHRPNQTALTDGNLIAVPRDKLKMFGLPDREG